MTLPGLSPSQGDPAQPELRATAVGAAELWECPFGKESTKGLSHFFAQIHPDPDVRVQNPDPVFAEKLLDKYGRATGELSAALTSDAVVPY
jgi:hypothetical protein